MLVHPSRASERHACAIFPSWWQVRDFALLYAVCKPNVDILMLVEHDSSVVQRTCAPPAPKRCSSTRRASERPALLFHPPRF